MLALLPLHAQHLAGGKLSPFVGRILQQHETDRSRKAPSQNPLASEAFLTAFVRVEGDAESLFEEYNCKELARFGNIYIAGIPINKLGALSLRKEVCRIEAGPRCTAQMDSAAILTHAIPVYAGSALPHAYTGNGVVMGVQDVGFDLTHPTFYGGTPRGYRIKAFWDQLSVDTLNSTLYVGNDYTTENDILAYAHSRDAHLLSHGTHTAGSAAGFSYPYRGMAFESDICLVSNAVSNDVELIDSINLYKYTSATDALGFKYIFDYAESVGKPCVISFSEGSHESFDEDERLYFEVLESLTGPGRIIVASAGNIGHTTTYFHKPRGEESKGSFIYSVDSTMVFRIKGDAPFTIRMKVYTNNMETFDITSDQILAAGESEYIDTLNTSDGKYIIDALGYKSAYNPQEPVCVMLVKAPHILGAGTLVSLELVGKDADVEFYRSTGGLRTDPRDPSMTAGEYSHSIHTPGSAPAVICVGATTYRKGALNYKNNWKPLDWGNSGERARFSSIGPAADGRVKPDVVAPGVCVISSYSSYFMEHNPTHTSIDWNVSNFDYNGRTYGWNAMTGTSMSTPIVGGAVALWLEACPTLTPDQVREVLSKTCRHNDPSLTYPNNYYGYGEIDVYAGLVEVLKIKASGLSSLPVSHPENVSIALNGNLLSLQWAELSQTSSTLYLYAVNGNMVDKVHIPSGLLSFDLSLGHLPQGVYAIHLVSASPGCSGSEIIRIGHR